MQGIQWRKCHVLEKFLCLRVSFCYRYRTALLCVFNINKRTNTPSAAPLSPLFPWGKLNTTQRGAGIFVLLFLFTTYYNFPNFSSDDCNHPKVINHKTHPSTFDDNDLSTGEEEETNMIYQVLKIALPVLSGLFIIGLVIFYGYHYRTNYSQDCWTFFHG